MSTPCWYVHLSYEDYKALEAQMREFKETTHRTTPGFYHKSVRLRLPNITFEFHAPLVMGYGEDTHEVPPKAG